MHIGKTWVNGLAMEYDEDAYNQEIIGKFITRKDFIRVIVQINDTLFSFYPCPLCQCCGYCLCPCTLGLSFLLPYICIRDAEKEARLIISELNHKVLSLKSVVIKLVRTCCTSWVRISLDI